MRRKKSPPTPGAVPLPASLPEPPDSRLWPEPPPAVPAMQLPGSALTAPFPAPEPTIPSSTSRALEVARLAVQLAGVRPGGPRELVEFASDVLREAERFEHERGLLAWLASDRRISFEELHRWFRRPDRRTVLAHVRRVMGRAGVDGRGLNWATISNAEIKKAGFTPAQAWAL